MALNSLQQGKLDLALTGLAQLCRQRGAQALHHRAYAEALRKANRHKEALAAAQRGVAKDSSFAAGWETLAAIWTALGNLKEAAECFEKAVALNPKSFIALNNLGLVLQGLGQIKEAEARYRQALSLAPGNIVIKVNLATQQGFSGQARNGLLLINEVLQQDPRNLQALLLASLLAMEAGLHDLGLAHAEKVLAIEPRHPKALHQKGLALHGLDRPREALAAFDLAEPVAPETAQILASKASVLAEIGEREAALETIKKALLKDPQFAPAWHYRTSLTFYKRGDPDFTTMEDIFAKPDLSHRYRINLAFALGKAYLDTGDGDRAFSYLGTGNALKRSVTDYCPEADQRRFDLIAANFPKTKIDRLLGSGHPSDRPIFVFGMPRSGTSLIEQILASHPLVRGLGELSHWPDIAGTQDFLNVMPNFKPEQFATLGHRYLERLSLSAPQGVRLVDKMPSNFYHAGLIALCLPGAKMIHARRDPLDTCLSCYSILFSKGQEYSYKLEELGHYYRHYMALMEHWRQVLPTANLFEIDYEKLVANPEPEVRRMLDFCNLRWDASCLRFYETRRRVATASLSQVRQPIYLSSVGRAEKFRPWLGQLEGALHEAV